MIKPMAGAYRYDFLKMVFYSVIFFRRELVYNDHTHETLRYYQQNLSFHYPHLCYVLLVYDDKYGSGDNNSSSFM